MTQLDLHARAGDPVTSKQAAAAVNLNKRCAEVLAALSRYQLDAFTDSDLAQLTSEDRNIVARRRKDLVDIGLVAPAFGADGTQDRVPGPRGRWELLWMLTDAGRRAAARLTETAA